VMSVSATQGQGVAPVGTNQTLTFTVTDTNGTGDLAIVDVLINNALEARRACYLAYVTSVDRLFLVNDAGDAGGPYAGEMALDRVTRGIHNSQCVVNSATINAAGNRLTMTLNVSFQAGFTGNRVVYAAGRDNFGESTGWRAVATWTVQ